VFSYGRFAAYRLYQAAVAVNRDASNDVGADYVNDKVTWDETFNGPDYTWWPFYGGPTEASHDSYNAKTTAIMRSPVGSGYYISTVQSEWIKYDDFMSWDPSNPFIWWLTRYIYTYTTTWSPGQLASMFVPPNTPSAPSGPTSGYTYTTYTYTTSTTDPNDDSIWYKFSWGDGSYTTVGSYVSGATASASHYWSSTGTYYVRVKAKDSAGLWSGWSSSHAVSISSGDGGGGGCPILSVYDETEYALEGLLDIHNPDGIDVIASHVLIHTPEPVEHRYLLRLTEHPQTYSHIDQVRLFAMLTNGTIVKLPLVSAVHSEDGNVKQKLLVSDDVRTVMLGENWNNGTSQYIDLKFVAPGEFEIETFTFIIEGHNAPLKCKD